MAYLLDGLVILIVGLCVVLGVKKGLIRTAVMLVGFVLAALLAGKFSAPVATYVYDKAVQPKLQAVLEERIAETAEQKLEISLSGLFDENSTLANYLEALGLDDKITLDLSNTSVGEGLEAAMDTVVRPALLPLLSMLLSFLLFLVFLLVVWLLSRLIDKVFKLPVLKQCNKAGGAVIGVLQGVFWAAVFATLAEFAANGALFGNALTNDMVDATHLVSRLSLTGWIV